MWDLTILNYWNESDSIEDCHADIIFSGTFDSFAKAEETIYFLKYAMRGCKGDLYISNVFVD